MISKTAEYAVRSCLWLAEHPGQPWSVQHIAEAIRVPPGYLAKVMKALRQARLVTAQPGPGGGFLLGRLPADTCVLEIIQAVDPLPRIRTCPIGLSEHEGCVCPLRLRLDRAYAGVADALRGCTLADLLAESPNGTSNEGSCS